MPDNDNQYFEYLKQRSLTGLLYRKYYLYPTLCRELIADTLDIGCGIGDFLEQRANTVGVDINPRLVEYCKERGLKASIMQPDSLPFSDSTFTSIILDNVLEHIQEPLPLLKEIWRVTKPGGRLVVGVPGARGYKCDADHKRFYTESQLKYLVKSNQWFSKKTLAMPIRSKWLDKHMSQYCIYGVFDKPTQ